MGSASLSTPSCGGAPRTPATANPTYGWLGAHQRSSNDLAGLTLMGVRLYNPTTGRFLTTDPVFGGNDNPYVYPTDPINRFDLDGRCGMFGNPFHACSVGHIVQRFHDGSGREIPLRRGSETPHTEGGVKYGRFGDVYIKDGHVGLFGVFNDGWLDESEMRSDVRNASSMELRSLTSAATNQLTYGSTVAVVGTLIQ